MIGDSLSRNDLATPDFGWAGMVVPFDTSVLLAESDHRIANHLALLMGYVRLKTAEIDARLEVQSCKSVHALLDGVSAQIAAVAKLHRALSDPRSGPADLGAQLREVCSPFQSGLGGTARIVQELAPGCVVRPEQVLPLSQIAAEVITNALRHASDCAAPGAILVRCRKEADGDLWLEIIDSGRGLPAGFDPETDGGVGFRLVRSLSQKLGARIAFESTTGGVRFCLSLPAPGRG